MAEVTIQNVPALDYMGLGKKSFSNVKSLSATSKRRGMGVMSRCGTIGRVYSKTNVECLLTRNKGTNKGTERREVSDTKIHSRDNNKEAETRKRAGLSFPFLLSLRLCPGARSASVRRGILCFLCIFLRARML